MREAKRLPISHRSLTDGEKAAAILMRANHMSITTIAEKMQRSEHTIKTFLSKMQDAAASSGIDYDFREDLKMKSIDAMRSGLDCDEDPYKRGTLGVQVAKGLGVLQNDGVQINQLIAACPPEWQNRYIGNDEVKYEGQGNRPEESPAR